VFVEQQARMCRKHGPMVHYRVVDKRSGYARWRCRRCSGEAVLKRKQSIRQPPGSGGGLDPAEKRFGLTSGNGKSLARFREEARKCVLVCANCHGEIEAGLRRTPPSMEQRVSVFRQQPIKLDDVAALIAIATS
jgi:hypothetical protein